MTEQKSMTDQKSTQDLPQPLRAAASVLSRVPGAGLVGRTAGGALDKVGAVSPRGRRIAVYTGAGVLGVAGIVEWPVAIAGAAAAWLTQPRLGERTESGGGSSRAGARNAREGSGTAGTPPTPKVLAGSHARPSAELAHGTTAHATPSDKLPTHHEPPPRAGQGGRGGRGAEGE